MPLGWPRYPRLKTWADGGGGAIGTCRPPGSQPRQTAEPARDAAHHRRGHPRQPALSSGSPSIVHIGDGIVATSAFGSRLPLLLARAPPRNPASRGVLLGRSREQGVRPALAGGTRGRLTRRVHGSRTSYPSSSASPRPRPYHKASIPPDTVSPDAFGLPLALDPHMANRVLTFRICAVSSHRLSCSASHRPYRPANRTSPRP